MYDPAFSVHKPELHTLLLATRFFTDQLRNHDLASSARDHAADQLRSVQIQLADRPPSPTVDQHLLSVSRALGEHLRETGRTATQARIVHTDVSQRHIVGRLSRGLCVLQDSRNTVRELISVSQEIEDKLDAQTEQIHATSDHSREISANLGVAKRMINWIRRRG